MAFEYENAPSVGWPHRRAWLRYASSNPSGHRASGFFVCQALSARVAHRVSICFRNTQIVDALHGHSTGLHPSIPRCQNR